MLNSAFLSCFLLLIAMLWTKITSQLCPNTFALCVRFAHTLAEPALGQLLAIFLRSCRRKLLPRLTLPLKAVDVLEYALGAEQLLKRGSFYMVKYRINPHFQTNFWHYHIRFSLLCLCKAAIATSSTSPLRNPITYRSKELSVHFHIT